MNPLRAVPRRDRRRSKTISRSSSSSKPIDGGVVGTNEIAEALGFAPPSVSGMVRRLADLELIEYERYRGVRLTRAGRRAAMRTIRRHRVIEAYLTIALGYGDDEVHDEAERIEHAASDQLIDRMAAAIGDPDVGSARCADPDPRRV